MPNRCVAAGCSSIPSDEVTLYKFPKDPVLRKKWIEQVKRTRDRWSGPSENSSLCSNHFTDDCYEQSSVIQNSFGIKVRMKLKSKAVPTIFKRRLDADSSGPKAKKLRTAYEKRERRRVSYIHRLITVTYIALKI